MTIYLIATETVVHPETQEHIVGVGFIMEPDTFQALCAETGMDSLPCIAVVAESYEDAHDVSWELGVFGPQ